MATISDSMQATITANWTGAGGAEPSYYVSDDFRTEPPLGKDAVWIYEPDMPTSDPLIGGASANKFYTLTIIVNTATGDDRLKELADEVERVINNNAITGMHYQKVKSRQNVSRSRRGIWVYQEQIVVDLRQFAVSSATAYGAGSAQMTQAELEAMLMYGSSNAAWVPCSFLGSVADNFKYVNNAYIDNDDDTDTILHYYVPAPSSKGTLKLYIAGTQIVLKSANASNYVTSTYVSGVNADGTISVIDTDATNKNSGGTHEDTFTGVDASSYKQVIVRLNAVLTNAAALQITGVNISVYYA